MTYEYTCHSADTVTDLTETLNAKAADGWEPVHLLGRRGDWVLIFRKPTSSSLILSVREAYQHLCRLAKGQRLDGSDAPTLAHLAQQARVASCHLANDFRAAGIELDV